MAMTQGKSTKNGREREDGDPMSSFILDQPLILHSLKHDLHTNVLTKSLRLYSDSYQFLNQ